MKYLLLSVLACGSLISVNGQDLRNDGLPYLRESESLGLQGQANSFFQVVKPIAAENQRSSVSIEYKGRRLALGTVTTAGVISKWSELSKFSNALTYRMPSGERIRTEVLSVVEDFDLAVLSMPTGLKPVQFNGEQTKLGEFLLVAGPGGEAHSIGVVSVAPRSLRESDKAFLGVMMDSRYEGDGVLIKSVEPGSGADLSGLQAGDVVLQINKQSLSGSLEMGTVLQRKKAGSSVEIAFQRGEKRFTSMVKLGNRPDLGRAPQARMSKMQKMGAELSQVRSDFPSAMQSDMPIDPEDCGGPVFNLDGKFVGIAIARASRTKSYIIPSKELESLILPDSPAVPKALVEPAKALPAELDRSAELRSQIEAKLREIHVLEEELRQVER